MQWTLARVVMLSFASTVQVKRSNGAVQVRVTFTGAKCVQVTSSKAVVRVTLSRAESAQVLDVASNVKNTFVVRALCRKIRLYSLRKKILFNLRKHMFERL